MTSLNVLIIEDDLIVASAIRQSLEDAGHRVSGVARESREAMNLLKNDPPDLAVIDITLGKSKDGGILIAQEMMTQYWMPFIYLTGHAEKAYIDKAIETFPAAYLLKPFRNEELLAQIELAYENFGKRTVPEKSVRPEREIFYLPFKNGHDQVHGEQILYLQAQGHCTNVFLTTDKIARVIGTNLGNVEKYFAASNYIRLSKSLFINLDQLRRIERTHIYLGNESVKVAISEANRKDLLKRLKVIKTK